LVFVLASLLPAAHAAPVRDAAQPGLGGVTVPAQLGVAAAGTIVQARYTDTPPVLTPALRQILEAQSRHANRTGPSGATAVVPFETNRGPETALPSAATAAGQIPGSATTFAAVPAAASTFTIFRNSVIPGSGIAGGYSYASYTQEPSTGVNGKNIFQTGNWYASRSFNNGVTWQYLNPFSIFGTGFCCDQVTLYDPSHDRQFWLLQYGNHLALANSSGSSLFSSWCYYNIDATWFGRAATDEVDYNDIALSNNYIYVMSNLFPAAGGSASGVLRLPIDSLISCGALSYYRWWRSDNFTFKPVQGATDVMYWGSNWGQTNGSSFRVFKWPESATSYTYYDRTVAPYTFEYRNSGQNCGSTDGVVTNWCQAADSRVLGAYRANGVLGFTFNAKQGSGFPFPYARWVTFRESDLAYLGSASFWGSWGAIQFLQVGPNAHGYIGGSFAWGGGTGTTHYYPGAGVLIADDVTPTQPWSSSYYLPGSGNTCQYNFGTAAHPDRQWRWGDYLTVRPFYPVGNAWVATGYAIKGANCGSTGWYAEPHNVIFGRGRDAGSVYRWWNT
jgi:hypothetical protein